MLALLERAMTRLIIALFVMSVCFATTPITSLHHTNLAYMPPATPLAPRCRAHAMAARARASTAPCMTVSMVR